MLSIVLIAADLPVVSTHRLLTARSVTLRQEVDLVLRDQREVFATSVHCLRYCCETCACVDLVYRRHGAALHFPTHIQAVAVFAGSGCPAVSSEQHVLAAVLTTLTWFCQCTGYRVDTGAPLYFCHSLKGLRHQK